VFIAESFLPLLTLTSTPAVTGYGRRAGTRRAEGGATVAGRLP
jgi:hypothetical protein